MTETKLESVKLAAIAPETPRALRVRLEGGPAALYEAYRLPGMAVRFKAGAAGPFPVALASQPDRRYFEALVDREDPLGEALSKLSAGAQVEVSTPFGTGFPAFDFRRHDLYLVGHGLGLAAVRAATLYALTERGAFANLRVLAEARFLDELPFRDELPSWQRAGVRVYQVLARPDMGKWVRGEGAYVFDLLRELIGPLSSEGAIIGPLSSGGAITGRDAELTGRDAKLAPDRARSVVFASGPDDMLRGVQGVLRAIRFPAEKLFIHELPAPGRERAREPERPKDLCDKISAEGVYGSGHQQDAADHAPGYRTPPEQPKPQGLAPYLRPRTEAASH